MRYCDHGDDDSVLELSTAAHRGPDHRHLRPCRCWMLLCRWWNSWWKSSRSLTRWCLTSSKCPSLLRRTGHRGAPCSARRVWRSRSWMCQCRRQSSWRTARTTVASAGDGGHQPHQEGLPGGITASLGRYTNTGQRGRGPGG